MSLDENVTEQNAWAKYQAMVDEGYAALDLTGLSPMEKVDRVWEHFGSPLPARTPLTVLILQREMASRNEPDVPG